MDLADYFATPAGRGRQAALCRAINAHAADVSRWASGERPVPIERCVPIERATEGAVTRRDLRPGDWHLIWPELTPTPTAQEGA